MKRILVLFLILCIAEIIFNFKLKRTKDFEVIVDDYKKSVVMINIDSEFTLLEETTTRSVATGFIVDAELGLIATNKHVTRISPTRHTINFFDGSVEKGTVVYYDFYHDFGFIQLESFRDRSKNKNSLKSNLKEVTLGSSYDLNIGDELMLIGNNEGVNYSIKYGNVNNLNVPDFNGQGSIIQTSFDRTGGSSGSPVWNKKGQVVAIHAMGDKSFSFEYPVEYIKWALEKFKTNYNSNTKFLNTDNISTNFTGHNVTQNESNKNFGEIFKYDKSFTGIFYELLPIYKFEKSVNQYKNKENNSTISEIVDKIKSKQRVHSLPSEVILISSVIPSSPADGKLKPGDVILKLNDQILGNDLINLEKIIDENFRKEIKFTIFRFGKIIDVSLNNTISTENEKINHFIKFSDTLIHPINFYVKSFYPMLPYKSGLFISKIGISSPLNDAIDNHKIVITSINSIKVNNLDDLINAFNQICDRANIYFEALDLSVAFARYQSYSIDLGDLNEIYEYNFDYSGWSNKVIKLNQCDGNVKLHDEKKNRKQATTENDKKVNSRFYYSYRKIKEIKSKLNKSS
jgi:S1-C subfamily serine protease